MALTYILDTSVVKRLARAAVREVVEPLAAVGELARPSICDLEIGYSARNAEEWDQIIAALDAFGSVDTTAAHVRRALQVQRLLAQRSQRGRKIPDHSSGFAQQLLPARSGMCRCSVATSHPWRIRFPGLRRGRSRSTDARRSATRAVPARRSCCCTASLRHG